MIYMVSLDRYAGHSSMVELLIREGACVNAFDKKDRRALHFAAYMGHENVVKILLLSSAEVNIRDKDLYTPLHAVCLLTYYSSFRNNRKNI